MTSLRALRGVLLGLFMAPILAACGIGDAFEGSSASSEPQDDREIEGDRLDVLQLSDADYVLASLEDRRVVLPGLTQLTRWERPGQTFGHVMDHYALDTRVSLAWRASLGAGEGRAARLTSHPLVANGRVYAMDANVRVSALDLDTGAEIWSRNLRPADDPRGIYGGGMTLRGNVLYVAAGDARLHLLNPAGGQVVRTIDLRAPARAAPQIVEGLVLVHTIDNALTAYSATTLQEVWSFEGGAQFAGLVGASTPAWQEDTFFATFSDGEVAAIRAEDGQLQWSQSMQTLGTTGRGAGSISDVRALPVVDGDTLIVSSFEGGTAMLETRNGEVAWELRAGTASTPLLTNSNVFFISSWGELIVLTRDEGALVWRLMLPEITNRNDIVVEAYYGPILANGQLIAAGTNGKLVMVNALTGQLSQEIEMEAPAAGISPLVVDGTLLVVTSDGFLNAYR